MILFLLCKPAAMKKIMIIAISFCCSLLTHAQSLNDEDLRTQFLKDWERAKAYTIDYLNTMPADKYSFKATDSVRSFAQQMLHLAQSNVNVISSVAGVPNTIGNRI